MTKNRQILFPILLLSCGLSMAAALSETTDVDNELLRLRRELTQVRQERLKVKEDSEKDKKEFSAYQERTSTRKALLTAETDSIKHLTISRELKRDSLAACAGGLDVQKKQIELLQGRFRDREIVACKSLIAIVKKSPPAITKPTLGSLSFLLNDCMAKNIDNVEGLHRLVQIVGNMEEYNGTIQTGQETSVVPQLRGSALMLRIGSLFEAVVDEDGKTGALWQGNDSLGQPLWQTVAEAQSCAIILKAINMRESKALPAFMALPYSLSLRRKGVTQ